MITHMNLEANVMDQTRPTITWELAVTGFRAGPRRSGNGFVTKAQIVTHIGILG